jgi:pyruvate/2-oxoglutarate dehydrogenase complex dihydrolipoamide dehydrogenase (E3) component
MAVDYDLVIIGATEVGFHLAMASAQRDARVAWICDRDFGGDFDFEHQLGHRLVQSQKLGVDLITEGGRFISPRIFAVADRQLSSRTFAIALPLPLLQRPILGIDLTKNADSLNSSEKLKRSLVIIGNDSHTCKWAQRLAKEGKEVKLLVNSAHILPNCDVEVARYLQAQMETEGIQIYTYEQVNAIEVLEEDSSESSKYRVWTNNRTFDCEQILLPSQTQIYDRLDLAAARVVQKDGLISLNNRLQTSNHRIYWCENLANLPVVLVNTLYFPTVEYQPAPIITSTQPNLVSLGITEINAKLKYGKDVTIMVQKLPDGIAKIICRSNGEILGIHSLGLEAKQITESVAIAMTQKLKIQSLANSSGILSQFARQFHQQRSKKNNDLSWQWFNFRRDFEF